MSNEKQLDDLLDIWEEHFQQGEDVPAEQLCQGCPELAQALADRIAAWKKGEWMDKPTESPATRYRLERLIGEGGSAQVWQAFDSKLERPVAVKIPKRRNVFDADQVKAFQAEALRMALMCHAGIVAVHDVYLDDEGRCLIVSDWIDGADLGRHLLSGPFKAVDAIRIVAEVAEALHHAHMQGLVHRDVKPGNILLDRRGRVLIGDFGLATTTKEMLERGDDGCGTLAYMSPEQLHGDPRRIDLRTDVYSLGVVLYEMLTGECPFQARNPNALRESILQQEPQTPCSINPAIPREIERICMQCLGKSPVNRPTTTKALAIELRRLHARLNHQKWRQAAVMTLGSLTIAFATLCIFQIVTKATWATPVNPNGETMRNAEGKARNGVVPARLNGDDTGKVVPADGNFEKHGPGLDLDEELKKIRDKWSESELPELARRLRKFADTLVEEQGARKAKKE